MQRTERNSIFRGNESLTTVTITTEPWSSLSRPSSVYLIVSLNTQLVIRVIDGRMYIQSSTLFNILEARLRH